MIWTVMLLIAGCLMSNTLHRLFNEKKNLFEKSFRDLENKAAKTRPTCIYLISSTACCFIATITLALNVLFNCQLFKRTTSTVATPVTSVMATAPATFVTNTTSEQFATNTTPAHFQRIQHQQDLRQIRHQPHLLLVRHLKDLLRMRHKQHLFIKFYFVYSVILFVHVFIIISCK
ncbi:uncharacterized protein LOC124436590 [Xenia sp. Carnegie-2017]|uniref:uncharacterized protein LOC124436590 n=1 Tax=Xenia sp. Carnegie-2017 TaxID=2897299 RepID=UPI001F039779|nr:uncharacterized protein LOC124436590 [Xenia sp. Carnegie-2017]